MQHELAAREYKLLLAPHLALEPSLKAAQAFWDNCLQPIIATRLDLRDGGEARGERNFETIEERTIRFRDTQNCVLTGCDYALRHRVSAQHVTDEPPGEITLKLRMPDLFVVAATGLPGSQENPRTKFEEDIAPLEIAEPNQQNQGVAIASPRSMRSRFSLSTSQAIAKAPEVLGDVFELFPTLEDNLQRRGAEFLRSDKLHDGPVIREFVYEGAKVRLGDGITGKFALTLWRFHGADSTEIAEISYKCKTIEAIMPGNAARRAYDLFLALQEDLADRIDRRHASKTALVLPKQCRKPATLQHDSP